MNVPESLTANKTVSTRIEKLDSIRGLAALSVVVGHCYGSYEWKQILGDGLAASTLHIIASLFFDGRSAVVVFFILSGYVLSLSYFWDPTPTYRSFIIRRLCRIYLPFMISVVLACLVVTGIPHIKQPGTTDAFLRFWSSPISLEALLNNLALTGKFNIINPPVWSLIEELRISVCFPLLALLIRRFNWLITLSLSVVFSVLCSRLSSMDVPHWVSTLGGTSRYVVLFVVGAVFAKHRSQLSNFSENAGLLQKLVIFGIGVALYLIQFTKLPLNLEVYLPWISLAVLFVFAINTAFIERILDKKLLRNLGLISFSLYLVHIPILVFVCNKITGIPVYLRLISVVPISILVAIVAYWIVERPCTLLGRHLAKEKRAD